MANNVAHGGYCCGARHVHSFGTNDDDRRLIDLVKCTAETQTGRLTEIILNDQQCLTGPRLLAKMAELGYVFVGRGTNDNHNSRINIFHRIDKRLPLTNLPFNWPGMVINPNLSGTMTALPVSLRNLNGQNAVQNNWYSRGKRVRCNNPRSRHNGREGVAQYTRQLYDRHRTLSVLFDGDTTTTRLSLSSFTSVEEAPRPAEPQTNIPLQIHDNVEYVAGQQPPVPVIEQVVVFSTFHNRYADGRLGAGYDTLEAATQAAPRCRVRVRRDIFNYGDPVLTEV
jgi:hypothetical protein